MQDASKSLLPGAMIVAEHPETGQKFTATANNSGEYLLAQLPVGVYSLTVSAADFKQSVLPRVEIRASGRLRESTIGYGEF